MKVLTYQTIHEELKKGEKGDTFHYLAESGELREKLVIEKTVNEKGYLIIRTLEKVIPENQIVKDEEGQIEKIEKEVKIPWYKKLLGKSN